MTVRGLIVRAFAVLLAAGWLAQAAEDDVADLDAEETITVHGDQADRIVIVPLEPVDAVFGLDKSLFETPRSATSIAVETMDRLGMAEITRFPCDPWPLNRMLRDGFCLA